MVLATSLATPIAASTRIECHELMEGHYMMHSRATRLIERSILGWMIVLTTSWLWGCSSFGPSRLPPDLFDYNGAIAESSQEQMLMNLVRLRYQDVPVFLSVSSVLSQYVYSGNASVNGMTGRAGGGAYNRVIDR